MNFKFRWKGYRNSNMDNSDVILTKQLNLEENHFNKKKDPIELAEEEELEEESFMNKTLNKFSKFRKSRKPKSSRYNLKKMQHDLLKSKKKQWHIVFYHKKCSDGVAAAWCFKRKYPNITPIPISSGQHEEMPERLNYIFSNEMKDKNVIFVDVVLSLDNTKKLKKLIESKNDGKIMIIDHHKSAIPVIRSNIISYYSYNINKSAAQLAWEYCFPNNKKPKFIDYVADRDLWKWEMPNSEEFNMGYRELFGLSFETFDLLYKYEEKIFPYIIKIGLEKKEVRKKKINELITEAHEKDLLQIKKWQNNKLALIHLSQENYYLRSDIGHRLCDELDIDFAAMYYYHSERNHYKVSLRSINFDTLRVSEQYDGGGHKNASGFCWFDKFENLFSS